MDQSAKPIAGTRVRTGIAAGSREVDPMKMAERVRLLAGGLAALGIGAGDRVAILMRNDIAFLLASYGISEVGASTLPLNWHFKADEVNYILRDSGAKLLIAHADLLRDVSDGIPPGLKVLAVETPPEIVAAYEIDAAAKRVPAGIEEFEAWLNRQRPSEGPPKPLTLSMIYTSGTTGRPKGVRRPSMTTDERRKMDELRNLTFGLWPGCRAVVTGPLYHSAPNAFGVRAGKMGERLVLMPRFDPEELLRIIERERIDSAFMVPTMFVRLLKLPEAVRRRYDLSSLRHVGHAAAPCPPEIKRAMIEWWGPVIYEFYGSTESGPLTLATPDDAQKKPGTVGKLTPGSEIRILDDAGRILPIGEVGEIYSRISGYPDFTYHNLPDERRAIERDGFITSGDMGYIDAEGYLFLRDRKRDMVISGGVNIFPAEIEAVLHEIPSIADCAVFGVPDEEYGETLMAVIEAVEGATLDIEEIRAALSRKLANYKVPRKFEVRHHLPREESGKIFKRRLRDPYWEGLQRKI